MPAISFKVFKEKIKLLIKRQTIRRRRKRPIKVGDSLYLWWQQRTSGREFLLKVVCLSVTPVVIHKESFILDKEICWTLRERNEFAIADGFNDWEQMIKFFEDGYGLPFEGEVIKW